MEVRWGALWMLGVGHDLWLVVFVEWYEMLEEWIGGDGELFWGKEFGMRRGLDGTYS